MSWETAFVTGGALAGGFVSGLAGFGTGLVALGIWLYVLPPAQAAFLAVICSVVSQAITLPAIWHAIRFSRVWPFLVFGLLGVPVGARFLGVLDQRTFKQAIGGFLLLFSTALLLQRRPLSVPIRSRVADAAVGFAGGVMGGFSGLSGPIPIVWASIQGWAKDERRAVFQSFNGVILGATIVAYAAEGLLSVQTGWLIASALPGTLVGSLLGATTYRRLSDRRFDRLVLLLLLCSGVLLLWSTRA